MFYRKPQKTQLKPTCITSNPANPANPSSYIFKTQENINEPSLAWFSKFKSWVFWVTQVQPS